MESSDSDLIKGFIQLATAASMNFPEKLKEAGFSEYDSVPEFLYKAEAFLKSIRGEDILFEIKDALYRYFAKLTERYNDNPRKYH